MIRLVSLDVLHTILKPRLPIYTQYSQLFTPFLGILEPESIKYSFRIGLYFCIHLCVMADIDHGLIALKEVQIQNPVYRGAQGTQGWWAEVIRRTAIGAGADLQGLYVVFKFVLQVYSGSFQLSMK